MMRRLLSAGLCVLGLSAAAWSAAAQDKTFPDEAPTPPLGLLPVIFWPEDNPYSAPKAELGRLLYFDTRLSSDNTVSCATCHAPSAAYTDNLPVSLGIAKQKGGRSAPTVINRAFTTMQFWDGRSGSLEDQAKGPLANPVEMTADKESDSAHKAVVGRIREISGYNKLFAEAFGPGEITIDHVAKAIATFERCVLSGNSPYDRYKAGDEAALTESQVRGIKVFVGKAACDACHLGFNFSDESFVNIGIGFDPKTGKFADPGRAAISGDPDDTGAFKTPTLREIALTGPYMHDGSLETLEDVVEHYDQGGIKNPFIDQRMKPLKLTDQEKADLVAFLKSLGGEGWQQINPPVPSELPR
jgi:cytochrome c peroxidase